MLKIDLHIHTVLCGHAHNSFTDITYAARKNGMSIIGINEHGPKISGEKILGHFNMAKRCTQYDSLLVLWGCESNLLNDEGCIDLPDSFINKLNYLTVGLHPNHANITNPFKAFENCFKKYKPLFITHPYVMFDSDFKKLYQLACDYDVMLELNLSSLNNPKLGDIILDRMKLMVDVSRKNNKKIIINSDAHFRHEIGDDSILEKYKERIGLTDDIIINNYPDELKARLKNLK